jgi:hypothetical protein
MLKGRKKEFWEKAEGERRRCHQWLLNFMRDDQPKLATKSGLRAAAMRELKISKCSFDAAWIGAIEGSGRQDWYEPLRRQPRTRN